jgi:hypothetical protein
MSDDYIDMLLFIMQHAPYRLRQLAWRELCIRLAED